MRFWMLHLDDRPSVGPEGLEEVTVVEPGRKLAMLAPLAALADFVEILDGAWDGEPPTSCPGCGAELPALSTVE
jgi:hypothetical protein